MDLYLIHLHEVEGAIEPAVELRYVDGHGELLVLELEHLVLCVVLREMYGIGRVCECAYAHSLITCIMYIRLPMFLEY